VRLFVLVAAAAGLCLLAVGCSNDERAPETLMDGSGASPPGIALEGVDSPAVLTRARAIRLTSVIPGSLAAECLRGPARDARPTGPIVERVGVLGETVTLEDASGLYGCDNSAGQREGHRRWCGSSFGRLYAGHLRDPRLDIAGCRTADGKPIGFAWVEPSRDARYVVVHETGFVEVYETAGALPVRISTLRGVEVEGSQARFRLSEHDAAGHVLREYELQAIPAG
jgi:hypothetical protein